MASFMNRMGAGWLVPNFITSLLFWGRVTSQFTSIVVILTPGQQGNCPSLPGSLNPAWSLHSGGFKQMLRYGQWQFLVLLRFGDPV